MSRESINPFSSEPRSPRTLLYSPLSSVLTGAERWKRSKLLDQQQLTSLEVEAMANGSNVTVGADLRRGSAQIMGKLPHAPHQHRPVMSRCDRRLSS
ncbi:uncharacterized protein VTP21DRAFT_5642 [Calcarisporiella thermophila]|uniref:uncharacterized protein n=1 Tax=Calcarisporiella thermophila TaxID=911321 RepID=UPI00374265D2